MLEGYENETITWTISIMYFGMLAVMHNYFSHPFPAPVTFFIISTMAFFIGRIFHRFRMPDISGQVLLGILLGPAALGMFSSNELHNIAFFSDVALGFMTFSIGTYLNYKVLHNSGLRILNLALFDCIFVFGLVFSSLFYLVGLGLEVSLVLAAIAIETAPGTVISLIQKKFARGVFTKTLVGVVALNNLFTIIIFEIVKAVDIGMISGAEWLNELWSIGLVLLSIIYGIGVGWLASRITLKMHENSDLFAVIVLMIVGNVIICTSLNMSPLLANLTVGAVYCNLSYNTDNVNKVLNTMNTLLFGLFFALAGTHLDLSKLGLAGVAGVCFVVVRIVAKFSAIRTASAIFKYPQTISSYLGLGLLSQAGLSIGLVISLSENAELSPFIPTITTIILAAVAANELIGPITTSKAFDLAKETGQATPRLVDFLHEEYILMPLDAEDKWDAIEKMTDFLVKTNHLHSISRDELLETFVNREKDFSTGLGDGLAIPHGRIPKKENLMGVIGICSKPIDWESLDGKPVDIVIMVATPEGQEDLHLKILSAIAKIFAEDTTFHNKMVSANSEAELYDLMQSKEVRDMNTFISEL